jgi:hypothetical protein
MSYNGTVHCNQCYKKGHNRRTCPQLTESYRSRAQEEVDEGKGKEGYWHKEYAKRVGSWIGGELATELRATRSGGKRRCKYCAKTGHNTRTCVELKDAKSEILTNTKVVRAKIAAALENKGLGIGALITQKEYGDRKVGYMVTGFELSYVNSESINHNPDVIQVTALNPSEVASYRRVMRIPLPPIEGVNENSWSQNTELVGPVSEAAVVAVLPVGWVDDDSFLEQMFKDRKSPNHYDNQYNY